jgi:hypothetical protein
MCYVRFTISASYRKEVECHLKTAQHLGHVRQVKYLLAILAVMDGQSFARFCQVVEGETLMRRTGAPPRSYLPFRQPALCLLSRPNSRIDSASPRGTPTLRAHAVVVGSVEQWVHMLTENAAHGREI